MEKDPGTVPGIIRERIAGFSAASRIENGTFNHVYRGTFRGEDAVLKTWDREAKYNAGGFEAELGVLLDGRVTCKPELLDFGYSVPYTVTAFIPDSKSYHRSKSRIHARKIAEAIKGVHSLDAGTRTLSDYYAARRPQFAKDMRLIEESPSFSGGKLAALLDAFRRTDGELAERAGRMGEVQMGRVHGDFLPRNTIVSNDRVFFTDWEESHIGCPYLDVAKVCLIEDAYMREFMKGYFGESLPDTDLIDFFRDYYRAALSANYIAHKGTFAGTLPHTREMMDLFVRTVLDRHDIRLPEGHLEAALAEGVC